MKYLTSSTTAISIVIAFLLFVTASWLEGDRPPPEPQPEMTSTLIHQVRSDTAVRDDSALQGCREAEEDLEIMLAASQQCDVDADCTIFDYGYPIQCLTSVAKTEISALRLEYRNYERSCSYRVYYDCPAEPLERHPVCRNRRCGVELRTLDMLKNQTLEHLGIEPESSPPPRPKSDR